MFTAFPQAYEKQRRRLEDLESRSVQARDLRSRVSPDREFLPKCQGYALAGENKKTSFISFIK